MDKANEFVKGFASEFIQASREAISQADTLAEVSKKPENGTRFRMQLEALQAKLDGIKQANNTFRSVVQHDVARAKYQNYASSFEKD